MAHFDRVLRADLDAGIAFPALLGFLVECFHRVAGLRSVLVQQHQVMRADVHASGLVLPLAAIAFLGAHKCRHFTSPWSKTNQIFFQRAEWPASLTSTRSASSRPA